jgi:hypothetical protein
MAELTIEGNLRDLFSGEVVAVEDQTLRVSLAPYEVKWLA